IARRQFPARPGGGDRTGDLLRSRRGGVSSRTANRDMKIPALLTILILPLSLLAARPTNAQAAAPTFPIRAAFYYPWFPETWGPVSNRYTHYTPTLGYYNSSDAATIDDHIARMEYAGINVGIAS